MPRSQRSLIPSAVQIFEQAVLKLTVIVYLISQIEEAGEIQERNGHTLVAVIRGRPFQAHHCGMGLDMGSVLVGQGSQRGGDVESEKVARLEGDGIKGEKVDAAQAEIPEYSLTLVKFT
jgi:hypothetical protein